MEKMPFLPWKNDNGLVCGTMPDGSSTFDIYDAISQPISIGWSSKTNYEIAVAMVLAVNSYPTKLSGISGLAEAVARKRKIRHLWEMPGMDEFAVKLNAQPTYEELKETKLFLEDVEAILEKGV